MSSVAAISVLDGHSVGNSKIVVVDDVIVESYSLDEILNLKQFSTLVTETVYWIAKVNSQRHMKTYCLAIWSSLRRFN